MDAVKQVLTARVSRLSALKAANIGTPRFIAQLESTIKIYGEIMKVEPANIRETTQHIQALMDALDDYWAKMFPSFDSAAVLYTRMSMQRQFVTSKLLEDYLDIPYVVSPHLVWLARSQGDPTDREQAAQFLGIKLDDTEKFYHGNVTSTLHEMLLDPDHVAVKLRAAAARNGQPASDIQPLIDRCEWASLASALVKDRILVDKLIAKSDLYDTRKRLHRSIDRVQEKYFDTLISPERFVISSRAGALSAKVAKQASIPPSMEAPPPYSDLAETETTNQKE
ncbi:hypothetical protein EPUS_05375 [Endocarpon pusillum Z07020]|uniref:Uncharacterized protein n=1 Tax=Endocarpon pusillum (strain Z07020 / HMAS-L-300199) TaxID=1263415 RepID=U1G902_ENDPU|nr:uncharacterized protein EPUS_05375 [Endocarpon pusillum Z07020]ERF73952.1 hypothetical protein EPUS_05375 [Endocarpon pusillum Z07020]